MQWNCPHCGTQLAVSADLVGNGWSFSKCYQCGGAALIRKAETNVIKVDRVPANERVILPEASSDPAQRLLSDSATRRLEQHLVKNPTSTDRFFTQPQGIAHQSNASEGNLFHSKKLGTWEKPHSTESFSHTPQKAPANYVKAGTFSAATIAILSGVFLYNQAKTIIEKTRPNSESNFSRLESPASIITDQVENSAMAPLPRSAAVSPVPARRLLDETQETINQMGKAQKLPHSEPPAQEPIFSDAGHADAVPIRNSYLKIRSPRANLRSGPGEDFAIIGAAHFGQKFAIKESLTNANYRWFKLASPDAGIGAGLGWVRNDLIETISE